MKILILADVFFPDTIGGAGKVAYHLGLELSDMGHEVHILTRNRGGEFLSYESLKGNLHINRFYSPQRESIYLFFSEIKNSYLLAKKNLSRIEFDIICVHQSMAAIGPLLSGCFNNIPIVYYYHSPWHEEYLIKKATTQGGSIGIMHKSIARLMGWIEKQMLRRSSRIIVLSRFMRDRVMETLKCSRDKIIRIPGGIDLDSFCTKDIAKITAKDNVKFPFFDKTIFFTVRNLVPRMGLENLIEAFNQSEKLQEKGILYVGGSGFLEGRLKTMVETYHLEESINFLGYISNDKLPGIYQAADFFILPTENLEGFGLVILEAMACGTPVLGTPVGAIPEIIGLFNNRFLFRGTGWKEIKEKLEEVIDRPDEYKIDPKACRRFVEDNYSWKRVADHFEEAVIDLIR